jgi:RimJ/RimL family protein N-acetyltransferase
VLAAQDWASQRNLLRMILETQSKNYAAIHLAMKLGYEFCGYNDQYYASRDIVLFFARFLK